MITARDFEGTWRLVSVDFYAANGQLVPLYGADPRGLLVYAPGGHMAAQVMHPQRPPIPSRDAPHALAAYHALLTGYVAYFGTYDVDAQAGAIRHHVQGALIPQWVGGTQVRYYAFAGRRLTLRVPTDQLGSNLRSGELVWERT
jgi:hypothetical protein